MNDYKPMNTNLKEPKQCPICGKTMPAGALAGLCPVCLLANGAETDGNGDARSTIRIKFEPPSVEAVAQLFPQLEILGLLGAGGMGAVYKARQPVLDRWVALKVLPADGAGGANFAERFNREARALARLNHPNIVAVHEFGQVDGLHFFLMEFVDGTNLRQLEQAGRLSPREALQLIPQICDALQYAHDEGVVHRDIKPENVLVDRKGRVKIADFGLAKIMGQDPDSHRLTVEGQVMGTPHYMAPEQLERPLSVDHRADIYSLGVVFYELLTGDLPLGKFLPPSRKVQVDVRLDEIVLRALENDPARRYQHASEVKSGVETVTNSPGLAPAAPEATAAASQVSREEPPRAPRRAATSWWQAITPSLAAFVVWLLVVVTAAFVTLTIPQMFKATARVAINLPPSRGDDRFDPFFMNTAMLRSLSLPVLEQAAEKLRLPERWAWRVGGGPLSAREATSWLTPMISVRLIRLTRLFEIECWNSSSVEAAEFANAVAEAFVDQSHLKQPLSGAGGPPAAQFDATVIDSAVVPLRALKPNVPLNMTLGLVGGGMLGGMAALFVAWMRRRAGVAGLVEDKRRSRLVVGAAVALVIGVPFVVMFRAVLAAQQAERQRALAVEKALVLATTQKAERTNAPDEDTVQTLAGLPPGDKPTPAKALSASLFYGALERRVFTELIDFDTGGLATYKSGATYQAGQGGNLFEGLADTLGWMRQNGFDAKAGTGQLHVVDMDIVPLENGDWDTLTASELIGRLDKGASRPEFLRPPTSGHLPVTFGFRTREKSVGILQLVAFDPQNSKATVSYKLVLGSDPK